MENTWNKKKIFPMIFILLSLYVFHSLCQSEDEVLMVDLDEGFTPFQFQRCFMVDAKKEAVFRPFFNQVLDRFNMKYAAIAAIFATNIAFDTKNLTYFEDMGDGQKYIDLCDGQTPYQANKYKPRGGIKIAGKCEYKKCMRYIRKKKLWSLFTNQWSIVKYPQLVRNPDVMFVTSAWKFASKFLEAFGSDNPKDFTLEQFNALQDSLEASSIFEIASNLKRTRACLCYEALGGRIHQDFHMLPYYNFYNKTLHKDILEPMDLRLADDYLRRDVECRFTAIGCNDGPGGGY